MSRKELLQKIVNICEADFLSNIAIVGPKRSGKTYFLNQLKSILEAQNRKFAVYGPVDCVNFFNQEKFRKDILNWLEDEGLLKFAPNTNEIFTVITQSQFWGEIESAINFDYVQKIIILFDNADRTLVSDEGIVDIFSGIRKFCAEWKSNQLGIHYVSIGNWIPELFRDIFFEEQLSWPFVPGTNLFSLPDFSADDVWNWISEQKAFGTARPYHAEYLWELTTGDPFSIKEIMKRVGSEPISCDLIYESAEKLIHSKTYARLLRDDASQLSQDARSCLGKMLEGYFLVNNNGNVAREELVIGGFARKDDHILPDLLRPRNWVVDSVIRFHWKFFKDLIPVSVFTQYNELIPPLTFLNRNAYEYICEIENLLRNQVMVRLSIYSVSPHPLKEIFTSQKNGEIKSNTDATSSSSDEYTLASEWYQKRVKNSKYVDTHAALISFRRISHLFEIIDTLMDHYEDPLFKQLQPVKEYFLALKDIRDAVAHNQIITEESYETLLRVRKELYKSFIG